MEPHRRASEELDLPVPTPVQKKLRYIAESTKGQLITICLVFKSMRLECVRYWSVYAGKSCKTFEN